MVGTRWIAAPPVSNGEVEVAAERPGLSGAARVSRELGRGRSLTAAPVRAPRIVGLRQVGKTGGLPAAGSTGGLPVAGRGAAGPVGPVRLARAVAPRQGVSGGAGRSGAPGGSGVRLVRPSRGPEEAARPGSKTGGGMKADPTMPVGRPVVGERSVHLPGWPVLERGAGIAPNGARADGQGRQRGAVLGPRAGAGVPRRGPGRLEISGGLGQTALLPARGAGSVEAASPRVVAGASPTATRWAGQKVGP